MNSLLRTTVYGLFYTPSSSTEPIPSNLIPLKAYLRKATHDDPEAIYSLSRHAKLMDSFLTNLLKCFFFFGIWHILSLSLSLPPAPKNQRLPFFGSTVCLVLLWKLLCYICFLFFALRIFFLFIWQLNHGISPICSKLIETAKLCLSANDKYLQSTIKFLDKNLPNPMVAPSIAVWKTDGLMIC